MLWDLSSDAAESLFKCWNTNVKLIYGLPRSTFTYLVEGHLAASFPSLRNQVFVRYAGFFRSLLNSPSKEIQFLARVVSKDPRSTTYRNLQLLSSKSGLQEPYMCSHEKVKTALPNKCVPEAEMWRIGLLDQLILLREEKQDSAQSAQTISAMIDSLCNT